MVLVAGVLFQALIGGVLDPKAAFSFRKVEYFQRFSKGEMQEYTPKGQTDLNKWTDMVTVNKYKQVKDGEGLASVANQVLETYKANKAIVVRTNSVPRTATKEAEHLVVVLFPRPTFIEAAFTRFVMVGGVGTSVVYSHRIYSKKAGDAMSAWLKKNGEAVEKEVFGFRF